MRHFKKLRTLKQKSQLMACLIASSLLLSGCGIHTTVNNEKREEYIKENMPVIYETKSKSFHDEKDLITNMEKVLENEYLELYLGENYDIAVYDKEAGSVFWSNPVFYEMSKEEQDKLQDDTKAALFSQLSIEYFNKKQKKAVMSSYPDSISKDKNQVKYEVIEDALIVTYGIGTDYGNTNIIPVFTGETFDKYDAILKEMIEKKEISIIDYRSFFNSYTKIDYPSISKAEQEEYKEQYPSIETLGSIYIIKPHLTNQLMKKMLTLYTSLGIDKSVGEAEKVKLGETNGSAAAAYFSIPVKYSLHGSDLIASIDTKNIQTAEGYYLNKVELLKSFGASKAGEEGYLFVPDGSGSIIENGYKAASMDKISIPFYGQDYAKDVTSGTLVAIDNTFPVFGIKSGKKSVFAIAEHGSAMGGVSAQTSVGSLEYNIAYPYFSYTEMDKFGLQGVSYAFYGSIPDVEYAIRYHFLYGEEADYSGMAKYYQKYLEQQGVLKKEAQTLQNMPLDIEFIGSIEKTINYSGIPVDTSYPVTTFEQAEEVMQQLSDAGIVNANVLYSGMVNGGMKFKAVQNIKIEKKLGGLSGFKKMCSDFKTIGYKVYPNIDFTRIYEKGNGISSKEDVSKYLNRSTVIMGSIEPSVGVLSDRNMSFLVNPLRYQEMVSSFIKNYKNTNNKDLYLSSIGTYLNGNYSLKEGVTRQTSYLLTKELLDTLHKHDYKMKFDSGNAYVLAYADSLTNIPTTSSHQRIESYSIPFVGMVLKGYLPYTGTAINQASNHERTLLEAIESGAGLNYLLMYEKQLVLVDTDYTDLFSVNYKLWLDQIISTYQTLNQDLAALSSISIQKHERVDKDVNCVTYENGTKVYVNYGDKDYIAKEGTVNAQSYLIAD